MTLISCINLRSWSVSFVLMSAMFFGFKANIAYSSEVQERVLESPRFLGRGNTYVAAMDSDDATKGNPASLGETKIKFQMRWLELDVMPGQNSVDTVSDLTSMSGSDSAVTLLQKFQDKFGKRQYVRLQFLPVAMRIMRFELSPFVSNASYVDMRSPTTPEISIRSETNAGANIAFGYPVGKFALGINVRPMQRIYFAGSLAFSDVFDFLPPTSKELTDVLPMRTGMMVGTDLGAIYTASASWRFGMLVENVGYTSALSSTDLAPPPLPQRASLGMMYRRDMKPWHLDVLTDVQDLGNSSSLNPTRLIHFGSEIGRNVWTRDHDFGINCGVNEGYFTGGIFADLYVVRFDISNFAVETGEYPGQRMDRRWALSAKSTSTF